MESKDKTRKQRAAEGKRGKPCCGTLRYLAECRGIARKIPPTGWKKQFDGFARTERSYTTAG